MIKKIIAVLIILVATTTIAYAGWLDSTKDYLGWGSGMESAGYWMLNDSDEIQSVDVTWGVRVDSLANCDTIDTDGDGVFSCGDDDGKFAWTTTTNYGVTVNATNTPIWFQSGLMASTTSYIANMFVDNSTTTYATTTDLYISNLLSISGDLISDFAGDGLTVTGNALTADLGTSVDLASEVNGNLPVTNLNSGTDADATTFWRGDGIWDVPPISGSAVTYYLHEDDSDIATYEKLLRDPGAGTEDVDNCSVTNGWCAIDSYITEPGEINTSVIPSGTWDFHAFATTSSIVAGTQNLVYDVYTRSATSTYERLLFTATSSALLTTAYDLNTKSTQGEFNIIQGDRLVVKFRGFSDSAQSRTIYLSYEGTERATHVVTTFASNDVSQSLVSGYFFTGNGGGLARATSTIFNSMDERIGIGLQNPPYKFSVLGVSSANNFIASTTDDSVFPNFTSTNGTTTNATTTDLYISGDINSLTNYLINDTEVLNATTLGSGILTSSLTTVGALNAGSITSDFGNIDIGASTFDTTGLGTFGNLLSNGSTTLQNFTGLNATTTNATTTSLYTDILTVGSATSTFANGIDISAGCFAIGGTCIGGSAASSTLYADNGTWTGLNTFANASTTLMSSDYASSTIGNIGSLTLPNLGVAAGTFLAVDATGLVIATSTPEGGGGAWATAGGFTTMSEPTDLIGAGTSTPYSKLTVWNDNTGTTSKAFEIANSASSTIMSVANNGTIKTGVSGNPTVIGTISNGTSLNSIWGLDVFDKYAVVTTAGNYLNIIDISSTTPFIVGSINDGTNLSGARRVKVVGKYAYVAVASTDRLTIVDISDVSNPVIAGSLTDGTNLNSPNDLYVSGKYAYVVTTTGNRFSVIDISDPTSPVFVSGLSGSNFTQASAIHVSGNYAYVGNFNPGRVTVVNIADPENPFVTDSLADATFLFGSEGIYVSGRYAYVATTLSDCLTILDVYDPTSIVIAGSVCDATIFNGAIDVQVSGEYAYVVTGGSDALIVVNVEDPSTPFIAGALYDSTNLNTAKNVHVQGGKAYVTSQTSDSLTIIDLAGIDTPTASIGDLSASTISVWDNLDVGNSLYVRNGINAGIGGIFTDGSFTSSATNTSSSFKGKLGIGTSTPLARLDIYATTTDTTLFRIATSTADNIFIVTSDGRVGIGTTTPGARLGVEGGIVADFYGEFSGLYLGDALSALEAMQCEAGTEKGDWCDINHETIGSLKIEYETPYEYQVGTTDMWDGESTTTLPVYDTGVRITPGRNMGDNVQVNSKAILQLKARIEELEMLGGMPPKPHLNWFKRLLLFFKNLFNGK